MKYIKIGIDVNNYPYLDAKDNSFSIEELFNIIQFMENGSYSKLICNRLSESNQKKINKYFVSNLVNKIITQKRNVLLNSLIPIVDNK